MSKPETYSSSSFDRFGDDMCELVLSYLSLSDKVRVECVSQQFRRCVYQKQYDFTIDKSVFAGLRKSNTTLGKEWTDVAKFKAFAKKLSALDTLIVKYNMFWCRFSSFMQLLEFVVKYSPYLRSIECHFVHITDDKANKLFVKFGDKLTKIIVYIQENIYTGRSFCINNVSKCTNLKELNIMFLGLVFHGNNNCLVKNIRKFTFCYMNSDIKLFDTFLNANCHSLECIEVYFTRHIQHQAVHHFMTQVTRVSNLKELKVYFMDYYSYSFVEPLTDIALKCQQIECLRLRLFSRTIDHNLQVYEIIKLFSKLKTLDLYLFTGFTPDLPVYLSSRELAIPQLTRLTIKANQYVISDQFFDDIHIHCPQLRYLNVWNANCTEGAFTSIAQLHGLRELYLATYIPKQIVDDCVYDLLEGCPHLKVIELENFETLDYEEIEDALHNQ